MTQRRIAVAVALFAALASPTVAVAQPRPMSQTLLKRIAEAVDGDRSGRLVWVVASQAAPNEVAGLYASQDSARRAAAALGGQYVAFGPYQSDVRRNHVLPLGCVHLSHSAMFGRQWRPGLPMPGTAPDGVPRYCPDPTRAVTDSVILEYVYAGGRRERVELRGVDAVFLSEAAIDKFVVPYYVGILGLERTRALRDSLLGRRP